MGTSLNWIAFNLFIVIAIALDLRVFHRRLLRRSDTGDAPFLSFSYHRGRANVCGSQLFLGDFNRFLQEAIIRVAGLVHRVRRFLRSTSQTRSTSRTT